MNATQSELNKIKDKQIFLYSGYLIYFDDVCMNDFVISYNSNIGVSNGMGSATVELLYTPFFADMPNIDTVNQTVENGICMRIFAENAFTRKYVQIFDGIIKQKVLNRSAGEATISFTAVDYLYWMQRIVAPIAIPFHDAISPGERLRWKAQSVDPASTATVTVTEAGKLKGKKVQEFFDILKSKTFENSKIYSDTNTVANFDAAVDRVEIMGDINEELVKHQVLDFVIDTNTTFADTMYVAMNNVTSNLLLEFYQDRDGIIRLKPPFWNEGVLRSHIIDPLMIVSAQEHTNWLNFYTRIITTGGTEEWVQNDSKVDFLTPVGVYVGNLSDKSKAKWADYTSEGDTGSSYGGAYIGDGIGAQTQLQQTIIGVACDVNNGIPHGSGYCLQWCDDVIDKALSKTGSSVKAQRKHCAICAGASFGCSTDWSKIVPGACVFGDRGTSLGHVGIYIGNGTVRHNNSGTVKDDSLKDWLDVFAKVKGCWGWGGGVVLDERYPIVPGLIKPDHIAQ